MRGLKPKTRPNDRELVSALILRPREHARQQTSCQWPSLFGKGLTRRVQQVGFSLVKLKNVRRSENGVYPKASYLIALPLLLLALSTRSRL
jgi:hypothetical protein